MALNSKLSEIIEKVVTTLNFYGVVITGMDLEEDPPKFSIEVSKSKRPKSLNETLDFAYWTLWTLVYGGDFDKDAHKIRLDYKEVK